VLDALHTGLARPAAATVSGRAVAAVGAAPHYDAPHAVSAILAIFALLSGLGLLGVKQVHEQVRLYAVQSLFAAGYTLLVGIDRTEGALIALAIWVAVIKVLVIPVAIERRITREVAEHEVPLVVQVPMSLLLGVALCGLAYWAASALAIHGALMPRPALGMPIALLFVGFLLMVTRQNLISQIVGLLMLENGVFFATVAIAPGLPFTLAFLLLLDLLAASLFYGVLARLISAWAKGTSIDDMSVLRG
jgi:hydrogenase-4 component E